MTITDWFIAMGAIVLTLLVIALATVLPQRFWKPKPARPQVPAKPGTVIELVADDGHVVGIVVLVRITTSPVGTSAEFADYSRYLQDRRVRPRDDN